MENLLFEKQNLLLKKNIYIYIYEITDANKRERSIFSRRFSGIISGDHLYEVKILKYDNAVKEKEN